MPGIDALTIGPADLAQDLGVPERRSRAGCWMKSATRSWPRRGNTAKCRAMLVGSFEEMQRWKEAGVTLLAYSSDADILYSGYAAAMKRIKGL